MAEAAEAAEPKLSIKQMKESIRAAGLPTADLLERADIDARYAEAVGRLAEAEQLKGGGTERVKDEHGEYNFRHQPRMTLARRYIADDDPRAAWASPAAVLDAVLGEGPLALDEIPAKLPWKLDA